MSAKQPVPVRVSGGQSGESNLIRGIRRDWRLIVLFMLPFSVLAVFHYVPMFGTMYAFQDVSLRGNFWDNEWVGFEWFIRFFQGIYAPRLIRNTLILNSMDMSVTADLRDMASRQGMSHLLKYAVIVVSSLPLLLMYPFVQKYFVKGIMVGSVKG